MRDGRMGERETPKRREITRPRDERATETEMRESDV